jgi:hypothetical protein
MKFRFLLFLWMEPTFLPTPIHSSTPWMNTRIKGRCQPRWKESNEQNSYQQADPKIAQFSATAPVHHGATADSDRAKRPRLAQPSSSGQDLNPGDRVEGLGNFGNPTGELGTVELNGRMMTTRSSSGMTTVVCDFTNGGLRRCSEFTSNGSFESTGTSASKNS